MARVPPVFLVWVSRRHRAWLIIYQDCFLRYRINKRRNKYYFFPLQRGLEEAQGLTLCDSGLISQCVTSHTCPHQSLTGAGPPTGPGAFPATPAVWLEVASGQGFLKLVSASGQSLQQRVSAAPEQRKTTVSFGWSRPFLASSTYPLPSTLVRV